MKKKIALVLSILMAGMLFGGCGIDEKITVNKDLSSKVTAGFYLSEEEVKELGDGADLSEFKKVEKNGKTYYLSEESENLTREQFENRVGRLDENCLVIYNTNVTDDTISGMVTDSDMQEIYDSIEFCDMEIKLPFTVEKSNAAEIKDDTIIFHKEATMSESVAYAVADAALLDGTNLTISGASEGGLYNKKTTITVNTADGVIKSMGVKVNGKAKTFSDETHPYNVNVCSEDGKYTVSAELFSGSKATLKFTVDRTKPTANVANNKTYKAGKKITFSDKTSGIKSAKLDGKTVKSGKVVKKKGTHKLVLTDKAGNKQTIKFKIK